MVNNTSTSTKEIPGYELLSHKIRFKIFSLLHMYPELSYNQLSEELNKSKSTIHPHLQKLLEMKLIRVSREEQVRGKFMRKFYSLAPEYIEKTRDIDIVKSSEDITREIAEEIARNSIIWINSMIKSLESYKQYFEQLDFDSDGLDIIKEMFDKHESFSSMTFLTENQFKKAREAFMKLSEEITTIEMENLEETINEEKPYYFFAGGIPLKRAIERVKPI